MKKAILLMAVLAVMGCTSMVMAQNAGAITSAGSSNNITWGIGLGGAALGNGFGTAYSAGAGLEGNVGYVINPNFAVLLAVDSFLFNTTDSNIYSGEVNFMPSVRLSLDANGVKPYVIVGAGLNEDIAYFTDYYGDTISVSDTNFVVGGGLGVAFSVTPKIDIYIQGKYDDVLASGGSFSYFPISAGVQFN